MAWRQNQRVASTRNRRRRQEEERLALDWKTLEYHPRQKPKFAALDMAKNIEDTGTRLRTLLGLNGSGPQKGDKAERSCGQRSPSCGRIALTASRKFAIPSSTSIAL